jgi:hypothetical protein
MTEPSRNALQPCVVCGRWFIRRPDRVCSRTCAGKLEEKNLPSGSLLIGRNDFPESGQTR